MGGKYPLQQQETLEPEVIQLQFQSLLIPFYCCAIIANFFRSKASNTTPLYLRSLESPFLDG